MILWLMMLHIHIKFGIKMIRGSEDVNRTTFTNILNLCCDLALVRSNSIFPQDTPAYDAVLPKQVWLQRDQQFRRYSRNSHILLIQALDTEDSEPSFVHDTPPHDNTPPYQVW